MKKVLLLDIDDTLVKTNSEMIGVWKKYPDGSEKRLSTSEFALDPDSVDGGKSANVIYDYREFGDKEKVTQSIINGIPLVRNLRILDDCVSQGYEIAFLTARANEEMVYEVLSNWLKTKVGDSYHPVKLNRELCFAINDPKYIDEKTGECILGKTDAEKKARVLNYVCQEARLVKFVDDDKKNLKNARALGIPNLRVITAWEEGVEMNSKWEKVTDKDFPAFEKTFYDEDGNCVGSARVIKPVKYWNCYFFDKNGKQIRKELNMDTKKEAMGFADAVINKLASLEEGVQIKKNKVNEHNEFLGATDEVIKLFDQWDLEDEWCCDKFDSIKEVAGRLMDEMPTQAEKYPYSVFERAALALVKNGRVDVEGGIGLEAQYESIKKQLNKKLNEDAYDSDCHDYLEALQNGLESGFDLVSYFDKNGMRLNVETDCGDFDVEYVPGEWVYVIHFCGTDREFTETLEHAEEAVNLIGNTIEEEAEKIAGEYDGYDDDYEPEDFDYGNEDHSMDFDDEDSPYYLGGGKGW